MNKLMIIISSLLLGILTIGCQQLDEFSVVDTEETSSLTKSTGGTHYYWHNDKKIYITLNNSKEFILYEKHSTSLKNSGMLSTSQDVILSSRIIPYNKISSRLSSIDKSNLAWTTITHGEQKIEKEIRSDILYRAPYFSTANGQEIGLSHLFYVKLRNENDVNILEQLAKSTNVDIIGNNEYMPLWYTLSCSVESDGNALEMANLFYESKQFASCQPDLMCDDNLLTVNDTHYGNQWHLKNLSNLGIDINFEAARSISAGNPNITIAVIDQGIQLNHPDLNISHISYDTDSGSSPSIQSGNHGTRCAGFISAKTNNGIGVASIAPNCKLMSISNKLISTPDSRQKRADGLNFARINGASVISNSWSSGVEYQIIDDAIQNALTYGRNGKGCVVVFASGNNHSSSVSYPANSNPDILAVGAIGSSGSRASFSNYGTALDLVAPGEVTGYTTDINSSYVTGISGTSFACPIVAGVAGLVLSIDPELTQSEVVDIIETTSKKISSYSYLPYLNRPNGSWNQQVGYGLVDAYAAAVAASDLGITYFKDKTVTVNTTFSGSEIHSENVTVKNNAKLTFNAQNGVEINPNFVVENGSSFEVLL